MPENFGTQKKISFSKKVKTQSQNSIQKKKIELSCNSKFRDPFAIYLQCNQTHCHNNFNKKQYIKTKMKTTVKITITQEYKLKCSIININGEEFPIKLFMNQSSECSPTITFENNIIRICDENENALHFMKEWIEQPDNFKIYQIQFQNKEYCLLSEVLFAIIINEFKKLIEKQFIIDNTIIQIPVENEKLLERFKISLNAIEMKGVDLDEEGEDDYDYSDQGEYLNDILDKKKIIDTYKRMIDRAYNITVVAEYKNKLKEIDLNKQDIFYEEEFVKELALRFTTKQRDHMKLCRLNNYCLFIVSRYFEQFDDHKNLTLVSQRMKRNMEKFHYNPVSVTDETVNFFPNIETLHIYDEKDEYLKINRIKYYCNWLPMQCYDFNKTKRRYNGKKIEFKRVTWAKEDTEKVYKKKNPKHWTNDQIIVNIPEGVSEIPEDCFINYAAVIKELTIPRTSKSIPKYLLEPCKHLTNITLPLDNSHIIIENKIFYKCNYFDQYISLPDSVKIINGNNVYQSSITLPSYVTTVDKNCFHGCYTLKTLNIPDSVSFIPRNAFIETPILSELSIPAHFNFHKNKLFFTKEHCLYSVELPSSIKLINSERIVLSPLITFTLPSEVTKLSDHCFANCEELSEIKGIENIKEIGKGCFLNCPKLDRKQYPEVQKNVDEYFKEKMTEKEMKQLEKWTKLKCKDILFDSEVDNWGIHTSQFNERIFEKSKLVFLIEAEEDGDKFGYYMNKKVIQDFFGYQNEDSNSFTFHLNSNNENRKIPRIVDGMYSSSSYKVLKNENEILIIMNEINLKKENVKQKSFCMSYGSTLCGNFNFNPKRFIVVQMQ